MERQTNSEFPCRLRVLGDSGFVTEVLKASEEEMERRYRLKAQGYDLEKLADHMAELTGLKKEEFLKPGRYKAIVEGRSLYAIGLPGNLG